MNEKDFKARKRHNAKIKAKIEKLRSKSLSMRTQLEEIDHRIINLIGEYKLP